MVERDPITTAKAVASIDHLSGGRFESGVGAGWNREEMRNHGTDPRTRMRLMGERIDAMKAIWTQDEASYQGEFVRFDRICSWPKPAQRPHPPVLVGGNGPTVLGFGDAWFPNYALKGLLDRAEELRGRSERLIDLMVMGVPADVAVLERLQDAGCRGSFHWIPSTGSQGASGARALGVGDRRADWRGVTAFEARERFAAARVARLASADSSGRPHLVRSSSPSTAITSTAPSTRSPSAPSR